MKIAYLMPSLERVASNQISMDLLEEICRQGSKDSRLFYLTDKNRWPLSKKVVDPVKLNSLNKIRMLNHFDVIHSHGLRCDLMLFVLKSIGVIKKPILSTIHANYRELLLRDYPIVKAKLAIELWEAALRGLDHVVAVSESIAKYALSFGVRVERISTVYNGIQIPDGPVKQSFEIRDKITLLNVASLRRIKGVEQILRAMVDQLNLYFVSVGGGADENRLKELSVQLGVSDRCTFHGYSTNPWSFAAESDIFVFPSYSEGFSLALIEAAANGLPIVCSDIDSFKSAFDSSQVTFFKLDDKQSLLFAINQAINQSEKRFLAFEKIKSYSTQNMFNNYFLAYSRLVGRLHNSRDTVQI